MASVLFRQEGCEQESDSELFRAKQVDEANSLTRQANLHFAEHEYGQAELLYWRALRIRMETVGPNHMDVAASLHDLAELYEVQDQCAEAGRFYRLSLDIKEKILGPHHPTVLRSLRNLADFYRDWGMYARQPDLKEAGNPGEGE